MKQELLKTPYHPKCVTIASRDHYCINSDLRGQNLTGNALNNECRQMKEKCKFNHRVNQFFRKPNKLDWGPLDIEDINKAGKS